MRWLSIIGVGEDGVDGLSLTARRLVSEADLVVGGARHLALVEPLINGETLIWPSPIEAAFPAILARRGHPVAVLASGDPFNFGIGKQLAAIVEPAEILAIPQPSAFSLAAARLGWALQDVASISLHGRPLETLIPHLHTGRRIIALSWDGTTPQRVQELLLERGFSDARLTILERMGGQGERTTSGKVSELSLGDIAPLNTIAIEIGSGPASSTIPLASGLDDDQFENDGQLTKREIRALTLSSLAPRHGELLWDVGLGAGSIAIEWLLRDPSLRAIGIEAREDRAERARRNARTLGVPRLEIVQKAAPDGFAGLPSPDAVFIGGGLTDDGVFDAAWSALKRRGRLVANAVTLESEARLAALAASYGGELVRLAVQKATPIGSLTGWRSAMPVTQWRVNKL